MHVTDETLCRWLEMWPRVVYCQGLLPVRVHILVEGTSLRHRIDEPVCKIHHIRHYIRHLLCVSSYKGSVTSPSQIHLHNFATKVS